MFIPSGDVACKLFIRVFVKSYGMGPRPPRGTYVHPSPRPFAPDAAAPASGGSSSANRPCACPGDSSCAPGYSGPLCSLCEAGHYREGGSCRDCDLVRVTILQVVLLSGGAVILLLLLRYLYLKYAYFSALRSKYIGSSHVGFGPSARSRADNTNRLDVGG